MIIECGIYELQNELDKNIFINLFIEWQLLYKILFFLSNLNMNQP